MQNDYSYRERPRKNASAPLKESDDKELVLQILMAIGVLVLATLLVAMALLLTEGRGGDSPFSNYWNCLLWSVMTYLGYPSTIGDWTIVTFEGQIVAVAVRIIAIAFFAAFTGLLITLIIGWYKRIVHRARIKTHHKVLLKAFHRQYARRLSEKRGHNCYVVPSQRLLATFQVNANIELKDVVEVASKYYGFRIKNLANIHSIEDSGVTDRFIIEHFPVNREYGCFLDRGSNVTIVSPSSDHSIGVGWFSYYIALMGGFNYISKDYDPNPVQRVSYYNIRNDVADEAKPLWEEYIRDVKKLCSQQDPWLIFILSTNKSKSNDEDIYLSCSQTEGEKSTIRDQAKYMSVVEDLQNQLNELMIQYTDNRFPLRNNNIVYASGLYDTVNSFTMRISSRIQKADTERLPIADTIAGILKRLVTVQSDEVITQLQKDLKDRATETYCPNDWIPSKELSA